MKIFLGLPIYREADVHFLSSLLALVSAPPAGVEIVVKILAGDSLICRARNSLTAEFMQSDCTHLLWIDSDMVFSAAQIARLASHRLPVVAGLMPKKIDRDGSVEWCLNTFPLGSQVAQQLNAEREARNAELPLTRPSATLSPSDGEREGVRGSTESTTLMSVRYSGTGFMLIARDVFVRMMCAFPELSYHPDDEPSDAPPHWDFWSVGPTASDNGRGRYLSEDWWFCERCQRMGIPVMVDRAVILKHVGTCVYPTPRQMERLATESVKVSPVNRKSKIVIS